MTDAPMISVVIPAYNEACAIEGLVTSVRTALAGHRIEIVIVNDGSSDGSAEVIDLMALADERVKAIHFSRNFGHQAALLAGLQHARGDAVIVMDADLQDVPNALPRFVDKWREGYAVVYAIRVDRKESALKRFFFYAFYRVLNMMAHPPMPNDAGNFGIIDRRVRDLLCESVERDRYFAGLRNWVGFRQTGIEVERGERYDGTPRVSFAGLLRLAQTAIFSFSSAPLRVFYGLALASLVVLASVGGFTLYHRLFTGLAVPGWTSIVMTACFFGAINAFGIAILGEYVIRIYDQVRARPPFVIERSVNLGPDAGNAKPPTTTPRA